ncbi:zinc finger protein with KRAB and SCAN domains 1-like [Trichomycterus rosablanca]|uniref:zinc finger protein with KRAB and SCAN domains 1-like n=1 Tax=Trichomycterus rosablanca TaxID=2290929 RepID=UPI002F35183D
MFQFGKYNVDIIEMLSGHQAHQLKGIGLERQLQHQQQVQLHQHQFQQQQQQQVEPPGTILSGLGLGPLQGSRNSAFSESASIFAKMSAPPPLQQQSLSSTSQSSRKSSKMSGSNSSGGHVSGYPQFLRPFHPSEAALAQEQLHPGVGRFDHFSSSSGSGGSAGGIGLVSSVPPPPPPLHPGLSIPQASPGPSSSSPSPSSSTANNPSSSSAVTSLGHQLTGAQSDARSLHQQFSCMLAANQYFLSGVPANSSLEQFLVQQGGHNHLGLGLGQTGSESGSGLAPPPALHSSHSHSHSTTLTQPQQAPPQQQQLHPHTLSHPHPHAHPHHHLHSSQPSSLGSFDFQGIPVLSSNQLASLMQQEAGLPLPLPLHLSLSKDEEKGDSSTGGSGGGRRKKAMAGYLPQRKADSNNNNSSSHSSANTNPSNSSTTVGLSHDTPSGLSRIGMSGIRDPPSHLTSSSSSSVVSSSSCSAPTSTSASVLVTNSSKTDNHSSMPSRSSEPEPLYHCGECGKTFTHLSSLRRHLRSHELTTAGSAGTRSNVVNPVLHPADPSIPHSTQDASSSSSSLCLSPDKTFHCSDCGKGFKKKGHLLQHSVIHSGARPFACSTCSRAFNRRESLTRHEKIHEEKPFRCPACGRCFRESTSLLNHAASGTCGKSGRGPRQKSDSSNSVVGGKNSKAGTSSDGMVTSAVGESRIYLTG